MNITFDLRPYSEDYAFAWFRISDDLLPEFRAWCDEHGCTIEDQDGFAGWQYIVNIPGKGGAAMFKLRWGGMDSDEERQNAVLKRDFLAKLLAS
ncbi:hypothetical protein [Sphingomonas sp. Ag1]|uniref:hypothetical protein n=1 Tax=Sphingomonas sp. Ag1 TaxID=1642949 RepID=UPI0006229BB6|nr:hypothetical protein [Sphingomonas sp. Ag1]KKI20517.1 hypothetical protein XM50_05420 [Sphingomonas sp. Ag1]